MDLALQILDLNNCVFPATFLAIRLCECALPADLSSASTSPEKAVMLSPSQVPLGTMWDRRESLTATLSYSSSSMPGDMEAQDHTKIQAQKNITQVQGSVYDPKNRRITLMRFTGKKTNSEVL